MISGGEGDGDATQPMQARREGDAEERPPDKQVAFSDWKAKEGKSFEEEFEKTRAELKAKKAELKDTMNVVNNKKKSIDDAKDKVARKQAEKEHTGDHDAE